ncbi:FMRFamide receptor-like [Ylistrum balloti]|uniref:FMRFamide receptor-like n=1 Tax=Ylistrum balloti TaxID=509963 RepID=UPI002905C39D|nr:FMRFamide receptor-like [Ylistrum balloti]
MAYHPNISENDLIDNSTEGRSLGRSSSYDDVLFIMYGVIVPLVVVFGYVGNIMTAVVLRKQTMSPIAYLFLQALVLSDIFFITCAFMALSMPVLLGVWVDLDFGLNVFNTLGYTTINYLLMTSQLCNEYILVLVSIDRYVCVCHPMTHAQLFTKFRVLVSIVGVLCFSTIYNIPRIVAVKIKESPCLDSRRTCYSVYLSEIGESFLYQKMYAVWIYAVINFVIPILVLFLLNILVVRKLMRKQFKRRRLGLRKNSAKDRVTITLVLIMTIFALIQTLGFINQIHYVYMFDDSHDHTRTYLVDVVNVLYVVNSSINFIIYIAVGKTFRANFSQLIPFRCIGN